MTETEEKVKCIKCGFELFSKEYRDKVFPPDKYNYCHSYCCTCCPDAKTVPPDYCDKEKVDGSTFTGGVLIFDKTTGQLTRWLPKR